MSKEFLRYYLYLLVSHSKTDNAEAVSILLEIDNVYAEIDLLDIALQKDFTEMAKALQQAESIKKDIRMCATCSVNIGCYDCQRSEACCNGEDARYCRACMLEINKACKSCEEYLCPPCFAAGNYHACDKCGIINCFTFGADSCDEEFLICQECNRKKCTSCALEDNESWDCDDDTDLFCPDCSERTDESSSEGSIDH